MKINLLPILQILILCASLISYETSHSKDHNENSRPNDYLLGTCESNMDWENDKWFLLSEEGERVAPLTVIIEQKVNTDLTGSDIAELMKKGGSNNTKVRFKVTFLHDISIRLSELSPEERTRKVQELLVQSEGKEYDHETRTGIIEGDGIIEGGAIVFTPDKKTRDFSFVTGYFGDPNHGILEISAPLVQQDGNRYLESTSSYRCFQPEVLKANVESSFETSDNQIVN